MKLPTDPKEKVKVLVLIGMFAAIFVFMLTTLVVKPMHTRKTACLEDIAKFKGQIEEIERDVNRMKQGQKQNTDVLSEIVTAVSKRGYLLQPRLGNYELGAREYVEQVAATVGVVIESAREVGLTQIPLPAGRKDERALKCYTLRVMTTAGMAELVRFLDGLETGNPYLCVSSLGIAPRADDPARHQVTLEIQWPVWSDPGMSAALEARLEEARNAEGPAS